LAPLSSLILSFWFIGIDTEDSICSILKYILFSVAIETVFLCFLEDFERNDGTAEKPYANSQVQQYFGKEYKRIKSIRRKKAKAYSMEDDEIREMNENNFKFKSNNQKDNGSMREMR